jgi:CBS domain containing-hemolysin-like protein
MTAAQILVGLALALAIGGISWRAGRKSGNAVVDGRPAVSRTELSNLVSRAVEDGTLKPEDSRLFHNALRFHLIKIEDVMTPRTVVAMMPADTTVAHLIQDERCRSFSRIPVYQGTRDNAIGYVLQREMLSAMVRGLPGSTPISRFVRKLMVLPEGQGVDRALRRLTESREHLALVGDEFGGFAGLITLEDLMETLLGIEILDESDRVADLRTEAAQLRERRLRDLRRRDELETAAERERAAQAAAVETD